MQVKKRRILVGRIAGIYGVKGWLKIVSYTRPPENIFIYSMHFPVRRYLPYGSFEGLPAFRLIPEQTRTHARQNRRAESAGMLTVPGNTNGKSGHIA